MPSNVRGTHPDYMPAPWGLCQADGECGSRVSTPWPVELPLYPRDWVRKDSTSGTTSRWYWRILRLGLAPASCARSTNDADLRIRCGEKGFPLVKGRYSLDAAERSASTDLAFLSSKHERTTGGFSERGSAS